MSRPLRLEYPGSVWHVTARGNARQAIFLDDYDRKCFLSLLGMCVKRFDWILPAYVLMPNHFHLLIELRCETLSRGMHWLNGKYSQTFNRRHDRVGHLFQGRYKGLLIEKETYFLEVLRYVVLNPVRAKMVRSPEGYFWSSHRAVMGAAAPEWLAVDDVLAQFGSQREVARTRYRYFVDAAIGVEKTPWADLVGQMYLGSDSWVKGVREQIEIKPRSDEHPREQRVVGAPPMAKVVSTVANTLSIDEDRVRHGRAGTPRMIAAWIGWHEVLLTSREIAAGLRLRSSSHVARLIRRCERELDRDPIVREGIDRCLSTIRREKAQG